MRARCVRVAREDGVAAALALGLCSRASLFRWQAAFAAGGLEALRPGRRGPREVGLVHPPWVEQVVIAVRLLTYWNSKRIVAELRRSRGRFPRGFEHIPALEHLPALAG